MQRGLTNVQSRWPRILLGVSGGIAAYKALELVRLATAAGHAVRVVQTPNSRRFVGEASFAALSGAPVLVSEFERDPLRGAFPDQRRPATSRSATSSWSRNADVFLIAPASANTIAKLAAGLADNLLTSCALAADLPAGGRAGDEQPHVRAPGHAGEPAHAARARRARSSSPATGGWPRRARRASGAWPSPRELLAACERASARRSTARTRRRSGAAGAAA